MAFPNIGKSVILARLSVSLIVLSIIAFGTNAVDAQDVSQSIFEPQNPDFRTLSTEDRTNLAQAINSNVRIDRGRDAHRHPLQTIEFFGIKPTDTVMEIWPGQGWYSTILASYLKTGGGHLIAANFDTANSNSPLVQQVVDAYKARFIDHPETFGDVKMVSFGPRSGALGAPNSVDYVLTFRNIHNWMAQGWTEKAFSDFYNVIKPGGYLALEEHRANDDAPQDPLAEDGYVRQDFVIDLALEAGFELVSTSEINANPRDTKNHPFGVWTLPPVNRSAPQGQPENPNFDKRPYMAIGESDRMTLLFRKPVPPPMPVTTQARSGPQPVRMTFPSASANTTPPRAAAAPTASNRTPDASITTAALPPPAPAPQTTIAAQPAPTISQAQLPPPTPVPATIANNNQDSSPQESAIAQQMPVVVPPTPTRAAPTPRVEANPTPPATATARPATPSTTTRTATHSETARSQTQTSGTRARNASPTTTNSRSNNETANTRSGSNSSRTRTASASRNEAPKEKAKTSASTRSSRTEREQATRTNSQRQQSTASRSTRNSNSSSASSQRSSTSRTANTRSTNSTRTNREASSSRNSSQPKAKTKTTNTSTSTRTTNANIPDWNPTPKKKKK